MNDSNADRGKRPRTTGPLKVEGAYAKHLASERLAADLEAFNEAGGHIEVLGTTRVLKKLDPPEGK